MDDETRRSTAAELMEAFSERGRRYLWTDAFAVCNYLALGQEDRAEALVADVHHELGRFRKDDRRSGWLSGLADEEGDWHPTRGGLRIGKPLPERAVGEAHDPDLEWERDGQYFHYLTKWMHALDQVAARSGNAKVHGWARELAATAHRAFTVGPPGRKRMFWKMSADLSRPLVASMGHHDPLDGFVTFVELDATASALSFDPVPSLTSARADFVEMLDLDDLTTVDPLGLGGLLFDACRLAQLGAHPDLERAVLAAAMHGLRHYVIDADLRAPASVRLAFRELGLAIGLAGAIPRYPQLATFAGLRDSIESFWLRPANRKSSTWRDHADINEVMLATALVPAGFLELAHRGRAQKTGSAA